MSCANRERVLSAMPLAEPSNALIIRNERTIKLDRGGNQ
jgi:hypothetical protein